MGSWAFATEMPRVGHRPKPSKRLLLPMSRQKSLAPLGGARAQHFTELHLASIFEDAAACASVDMPPPDFDHMFEIVFTGFSN